MINKTSGGAIALNSAKANVSKQSAAIAQNNAATRNANATAHSNTTTRATLNDGAIKLNAVTNRRKPSIRARTKTPINATSHVYIRRGYLYLYARLNGKTYRHTTGKEATGENIEWAKNNWERVIRRAIRKKEAKEAAKRKAEREALKALKESATASLAATPLANVPFGVMPTISEYGLQALKLGSHSRKIRTNVQYEYVFATEIVPAFGALKLDEIKAFHIKRWQCDLLSEGLNPSTIQRYRSVLSLILKEAITDEIIDRNPISLVKPPKGKPKEKQPFTMGEIVKLISIEKDSWFRDYLIISFFTGLRIGEAFALEWKHIDFDNKIIYVTQAINAGVLGTPKTPSSIRTIDMLPIVEEALRRQHERTGYLDSFIFLNKYNRMFKDRSNVRKTLWRTLLKQCGLEYRELYATRHTFASLMLSQSEEPMWVSAMLGHKNLAITLGVYAKYIPRRHVKRASFLDNYDFGKSNDARLMQAA